MSLPNRQRYLVALVSVLSMPTIGTQGLAADRACLEEKPTGESREISSEAQAARSEALHAKMQELLAKQPHVFQKAMRENPEWQSYLAHIGAAEASLRLNEISAAKRWLAKAPGSFRNWEWSYFSSQVDQSLGVLANVNTTVFEIAVSPDGTMLALARDDGVLCVLDALTGKELLSKKAHEGQMFRTAFSPDGLLIGTTGRDNVAKLWDAKTGEERLVFRGHDKPVTGIVFSGDGHRVATSSYTALSEAPYVLGTIKIWDAKSGEVIATLTGGEKPISMIRFSPDGKRVVASTWHGQVDVWETDKPERTTSLKVPEEDLYTALNCVDFSPDGEKIVAGSKDHTARVWDAISGELLGTMKHDGWVTATTFSPDGRRIVTGSHDNLVRLWDLTTFKELAVLRGHEAGLWSVVFSRDGKRLISAGVGGEVRQWDATFEDYGDVRLMKASGCYAVQFSKDDRVLYSCNHDGTITTWDTATNKVLKSWIAHEGNTTNTVSAADDGRVLSCSWDKTAKVWDGATGELYRKFEHDVGIYYAAISADGRRVATALRGRPGIKILDVDGSEEPKELNGFEKGITSIEFSPIGWGLVSAGTDGAVRVWNTETGLEESAMHGHKGSVMHAIFSSDGKLVASAGGDGTVRLWTIDGKSLWSRSVANSEVNRVAFSPDGSRIAAGSQVCTILDTSNGDVVASLRPHKETIWDLSFSNDGKRLATASTTGEIVILDVRSVRERLNSAAPTEPVAAKTE